MKPIKKYITTIEPNSSFTITSYKNDVYSAENANKPNDPLDKQFYFIRHCGQQTIQIELPTCKETNDYCLENSMEENEINAIYQVNVFNQITATNTVLTNARADYRAGKKIILKPGFKAVKGSYFNARINDVCNNYRTEEAEIIQANNSIEKLEVLLFPNPANEVVHINYQLPQTGNLIINLYNATGKKLHTINKPNQNKGKHELMYNIESLSAGIYYLKIGTHNYMQTKKLIVHQ